MSVKFNRRFYYAQSLYQAGIFVDALRALKQISEHEGLRESCLQLQSAILYSSEDFAGAQSVLNQRAAGNAETLNDEGCLLFHADQYEKAVQRFSNALKIGGFNPLVAYNLALSHFHKKEKIQAVEYTSEYRKERAMKLKLKLNCLFYRSIYLFFFTFALKAEIVDRGIRNHPELGIGAQIDTDGSARSVGNPVTMAMSGITQALNLKAAIEYQDGNCAFSIIA